MIVSPSLLGAGSFQFIDDLPVSVGRSALPREERPSDQSVMTSRRGELSAK